MLAWSSQFLFCVIATTTVDIDKNINGMGLNLFLSTLPQDSNNCQEQVENYINFSNLHAYHLVLKIG